MNFTSSLIGDEYIRRKTEYELKKLENQFSDKDIETRIKLLEEEIKDLYKRKNENNQ